MWTIYASNVLRIVILHAQFQPSTFITDTYCRESSSVTQLHRHQTQGIVLGDMTEVTSFQFLNHIYMQTWEYASTRFDLKASVYTW